MDADEWPVIFEYVSEGHFKILDVQLAYRLLKEFALPFKEELASLICFLSAAVRNGHLCIKINSTGIFPNPRDILGDSGEKLFTLLYSGYSQIHLCEKFLVQTNSFIYFKKFKQLENRCIENFLKIFQQEPAIKLTIEEEDLSLLPEQRESIKKACTYPLSIITGGPGTGKTFTAAKLISSILKNLPNGNKEKFEIALAAPTGKAAANLQSSLTRFVDFPIQVKTLHSLLSMYSSHTSFSKLSADLILIDESSMIDFTLMNALFHKVKSGARLILIGDANQLPPVEAGSIFSNLIHFLSNHERYHDCVCQLKTCLRIETKGISEFAEAVYGGEAEKVLTFLESNSSGISFKEIDQSDIKLFYRHILQKVDEQFLSLNSETNFEEIFKSLNRFRILTPMRQGPLGTDTLNQIIYKFLSTKKNQKIFPIMITRNDSRTELYNGEIGLVIKKSNAFEFDKGDAAIFFDNATQSIRKIPALLLPQYEFAFCLSVHKSQGSEFEEVLLLLAEGSQRFGREILYTGVTRARKKLHLWGSKEILQETILKKMERLSGIETGLRNYLREDKENLLVKNF